MGAFWRGEVFVKAGMSVGKEEEEEDKKGVMAGEHGGGGRGGSAEAVEAATSCLHP